LLLLLTSGATLPLIPGTGEGWVQVRWRDVAW
jgi:hypothetical protein